MSTRNPDKTKLWVFADRVWERAKKNPVMGLRAVGPLPIEQVYDNRLFTLQAIAKALAPNMPADHWRVQGAYLSLIDRHLGATSKARAKAKMKRVGQRYSKPQGTAIHMNPEQVAIRDRGREISRRRAMDTVVRHLGDDPVQPGLGADRYPEATSLLKTLKDFTDRMK